MKKQRKLPNPSLLDDDFDVENFPCEIIEWMRYREEKRNHRDQLPAFPSLYTPEYN